MPTFVQQFQLALRTTAQGDPVKGLALLRALIPVTTSRDEQLDLAQALAEHHAGADALPLVEPWVHEGATDEIRLQYALVLSLEERYPESAAVLRGLLDRDEPHYLAFKAAPPVLAQIGALGAYLEWADRLKPKYGDHPDYWASVLWARERLGDHAALWNCLEGLSEAVMDDSTLLRFGAMMSLYGESIPEAKVQARHDAFGAFYESAIAPRVWRPNPRDAGRKLRVAFASADFRHHAVGFMMRDVIELLDRDAFQVYMVKFGPVMDDVTEWFAKQGKMLRASGLSPVEVVRAIDAAKIDILIDVGGPTSDMESGIFAFQAAPVQLSWAAYPHDSPLRRVRYRLSDTLADEPSDRVWRMEPPFETCHWFDPIGHIRPRQLERRTFGYLGNPLKLQPSILSAWGKILWNCPDAQFVFQYGRWQESSLKTSILTRLVAAGASSDQIEFRNGIRDMATHLDTLNDIDVILDTSPYNGTTTLFDALAYGVPFVTFEGPAHRSRVGAMIARVMGRPDWVAGSLDKYIELAVASSMRSLEDRAALQAAFRASDLQNGPKMAEKFGEALREIWELYCNGELD